KIFWSRGFVCQTAWNHSETHSPSVFKRFYTVLDLRHDPRGGRGPYEAKKKILEPRFSCAKLLGITQKRIPLGNAWNHSGWTVLLGNLFHRRRVGAEFYSFG